MLKTSTPEWKDHILAYHLGEGRVLKTPVDYDTVKEEAYHLGEGRVLKTFYCL